MKTRMYSALIASLASVSIAFAAPNADEIMTRSYGLAKADDMASTMTMTLKQANGATKVRKLRTFMKKTAAGTDSLAEFISPADIAGTKFLTIGNKVEGDSQRLYMPALGKIRKIASSGKGGKFMGSELSYYDMEEHSLSEFKFSYVRTNVVQSVRNGKAVSIPCHIITSVPQKPEAPYAKMTVWVAADDFFVYRTEMFDKSGAAEKTVTVNETLTTNGVIVAVRTSVESVSGNSTLIQSEK
ncbi:MAG: outer membrane lipoprotein-sorting protein, partial [Spirochaetota bacterium]